MFFSFVGFLVFAMATLVSSQTKAAGLSFDRLSCHSTISSDLDVLASETRITFNYLEYGQDLLPLLEAVSSESIPSDLLHSFRCIKLTVELPLSSCMDAGDGARAAFVCDWTASEGEFAAFEIAARVGCYDDEAEVYRGFVHAVSLASDFYQREDRSHFSARGSVRFQNRPDHMFEFVTDRYKAFNWDYDGIRQPPECRVDGAAIVF